MRHTLITIASAVIISAPVVLAQDSLVIQENTIGVCTMDGVIETSAGGYTGEGYANIDNGTGIGMSWSFEVSIPGTYRIFWRYALGGSDVTSRDAGVILNTFLIDTVKFPHSGSSLWSKWLMTDTVSVYLEEGLNSICLSSLTEKGLPNIDYFQIMGKGLAAAQCIPSFTFEVNVNNPVAGNVSYEPVQDHYSAGTEITVNATVNQGYFFHSWSGEEASTESTYTFKISENTHMTALYYPDGTTMDTSAVGYVTVQHDNGTPYLLIGGALGDTVEANSLDDLIGYLGDEDPYVVKLSKHITGTNTDEIKIRSNKTLLGTNDSAHIEGILVAVQNARNVIIKNITFSKVVRFDALEINSKSTNIWIDHCEFFSDLDHHTDYYDGLLDIKNQSSFITVSWTRFHHHKKCILISSGDQEVADSVIRITFHHNYFHDCNSRLPSLRFGKAHIFNNYYENCGTAINSRMNACVKVEKNYFLSTGTGVGMLYSPIPGSVDLVDNIFENTGYADSPVCQLDIPYSYSSVLDPAEDLPTFIPDNTRYTEDTNTTASETHSHAGYQLYHYPNPATTQTTVVFTIPERSSVSIHLWNILGNEIDILLRGELDAGRYEVNIHTGNFNPGIYFYQLRTNQAAIVNSMIIQ